MIRSLIREQFLKGNTSEHDAFKSVCEEHEWNPDDEDLIQQFKIEYENLQDWWKDVQEERRAAEWYDEQIDQTDKYRDNEIRHSTIKGINQRHKARKYG